jgi:hypothetical protein
MAANILNSPRAVQMSVGACPERSRMGRPKSLISRAKLRVPINSAIFLSDESVHESEGGNQRGFFRPDILCRQRFSS